MVYGDVDSVVHDIDNWLWRWGIVLCWCTGTCRDLIIVVGQGGWRDVRVVTVTYYTVTVAAVVAAITVVACGYQRFLHEHKRNISRSNATMSLEVP